MDGCLHAHTSMSCAHAHPSLHGWIGWMDACVPCTSMHARVYVMYTPLGVDGCMHLRGACMCVDGWMDECMHPRCGCMCIYGWMHACFCGVHACVSMAWMDACALVSGCTSMHACRRRWMDACANMHLMYISAWTGMDGCMRACACTYRACTCMWACMGVPMYPCPSVRRRAEI
jgi:hypothetical protein